MLQKRQAVYHLRKNRAYPFRLARNKHNLDIIEQMLEFISYSVGETRANIKEKLQYFARQIWQPRICQAVVKLLLDKAIFEENIAKQQEVRAQIFEASKKFWQNLQTIPNIEEIVPKILNASFQEIPKLSENLLYKDLPANQTLIKMEPLSSNKFLDWVDLCMLKALLLHAKSMNIIFYKTQQNLRVFMRYLKFFGLLFSVKEQVNSSELSIEGADSVLESSRSYSINFCNLLPAALLVEGNWQITANLQLLEKKNCFVEITPDDGYKSFYKKEGFLRQQKIVDLVKNWHSEKTKVRISEKIFSVADNLWLLPDIEVLLKNKLFYFEWVQYPLANSEFLQRKIKASDKNYFFFMVGARKKLSNLFKNAITEKKIICFAKNLIHSKLEEHIL